MIIWLLFALGSAFANSLVQSFQKWAVMFSGYSKVTITFLVTVAAALILLAVSAGITGVPKTDQLFWVAVIISGVLNAVALPIILNAYEVGEFSSVYSMILLTPVFLLVTSYLFLGEMPSALGVAGVAFTVFGLWFTASGHGHTTAVPNFSLGNRLGIVVAFMYSITANFDKIAAQHSDRFLGQAVSLAITALACLAYLFVRRHSLSFVPRGKTISSLGILIAMGFFFAVTNVLHSSALLAGYVSYTIAIKRAGVLFGLLWGALFFKERITWQKLTGIAVSLAGMAAIIFS